MMADEDSSPAWALVREHIMPVLPVPCSGPLREKQGGRATGDRRCG
jgi:hypothetical protein